MLHSIVVIVIVRAGPELDLFDLHGDLLLIGLVGTLFLLVQEFAVIDYLAHRRLAVRRDLDEVEAASSGFLDRVARVHDAQRLAIVGHDPDRRNSYPFICPVLRFALPRTEISTTKSSSDMCLLWL